MTARVRLIDGHMYPHAQEGAIGEIVAYDQHTSNLLVDWGNGPVKTHATRLEYADGEA